MQTKKTLIGHVGRIDTSLVVKCGGAVVREELTNQGAGTLSTRAKRMKRTTTHSKRKFKTRCEL